MVATRCCCNLLKDKSRRCSSETIRSTRLRAIRESSFADCRSEEHTSELQSRFDLVCRLLLEKKKAVLDLTAADFDFLPINIVSIAPARIGALRCIVACVYVTLDFVGYPLFPSPAECIATVIA